MGKGTIHHAPSLSHSARALHASITRSAVQTRPRFLHAPPQLSLTDVRILQRRSPQLTSVTPPRLSPRFTERLENGVCVFPSVPPQGPAQALAHGEHSPQTRGKLRHPKRKGGEDTVAPKFINRKSKVKKTTKLVQRMQ